MKSKKVIELSYEGYLTEEKLVKMLKELSKEIGAACAPNYQIAKYRGDIVINDKYLIEFDGYQHYTNASVFNRDSTKDAIWDTITKGRGVVIRIPYFVQLTNQTFHFFFKKLLKEFQIQVKIKQNYAHGFIDKKAVLPANFCTLGERRFIYDLNTLPQNVLDNILISLFDQCIKKEPIEVFSLNLRDIPWINEIFDEIRQDVEMPEDFFGVFDSFFKFEEIYEKQPNNIIPIENNINVQ